MSNMIADIEAQILRSLSEHGFAIRDGHKVYLREIVTGFETADPVSMQTAFWNAYRGDFEILSHQIHNEISQWAHDTAVIEASNVTAMFEDLAHDNQLPANAA